MDNIAMKELTVTHQDKLDKFTENFEYVHIVTGFIMKQSGHNYESFKKNFKALCADKALREAVYDLYAAAKEKEEEELGLNKIKIEVTETPNLELVGNDIDDKKHRITETVTLGDKYKFWANSEVLKINMPENHIIEVSEILNTFGLSLNGQACRKYTRIGSIQEIRDIYADIKYDKFYNMIEAMAKSDIGTYNLYRRPIISAVGSIYRIMDVDNSKMTEAINKADIPSMAKDGEGTERRRTGYGDAEIIKENILKNYVNM